MLHHMLKIGALVGIAFASATTQAEPPAAAPPATAAPTCLFDSYPARAVAPYTVETNLGYGTATELRGAQVFVNAKPGLTAEWLNRETQLWLRNQPINPNDECSPPTRNMMVDVAPGGPGFWVRLAARDEKTGRKVMNWARNIEPEK
jgi:hypothetical protein